VTNKYAEVQNLLLRHEQGHYDLIALTVRDSYNKLMELRKQTFRAKAEVIKAAEAIQNIGSLLQKINELYETETDGGTLRGRQELWDGKFGKARKDNVPLEPLVFETADTN